MLFRGLNPITIDVKGRVAIPTRYRQALDELCAGKLVLTIDTEQPCLLLYPLPAWLEIEKKLAVLPSFHPASRRIQRLLIGHATEIEIDTQGRLLIPPALREYAGLEKELALIGQGNKFELWQLESWQAERHKWLQTPLQASDEVPEEMRQLSL